MTCDVTMWTQSDVKSRKNEYLSRLFLYKVFSCDVTVAMLVSLNKGTAVMLVSPTNPLGTELYSYANSFFYFASKMCSSLCTVITLITKFHDMFTVTFPWQHNGLQVFVLAFCFCLLDVTSREDN